MPSCQRHRESGWKSSQSDVGRRMPGPDIRYCVRDGFGLLCRPWQSHLERVVWQPMSRLAGFVEDHHLWESEQDLDNDNFEGSSCGNHSTTADRVSQNRNNLELRCPRRSVVALGCVRSAPEVGPQRELSRLPSSATTFGRHGRSQGNLNGQKKKTKKHTRRKTT